MSDDAAPLSVDTAVYKTLLESTQAIPWRIDWEAMRFSYIGPQIERLLIERDQIVAAWKKAHPDTNAYEDRDLELISEIVISIDDQVKAVTKALRKK